MSSGGTVWDAPNQQVVREDQSGPWEEGSGGDPVEPHDEPGDGTDEEPTLDEMTKTELLEYAQAREYSPANHSMTKEEIRATIDENEPPAE
jgi:hypothetical protein